MQTGAQAIVEALERAGVEVVFGLPGVHNLSLWKALRESRIRLVGTRHEQAAAYAADGYARATGRPGVALVTTGPGAANTLGAVGEACASRSPILVIATDVPTTLARDGVAGGSLHETVGQADMFAPVTTRRTVVRDAVGEVPLPAGGPALLQVPTDLLDAPAADAAPVAAAVADAHGDADVRALLDNGQRPLIWAGSGAVRGGEGPAVAALAEALGAPVMLTYGAKGLLPPAHPLLVGPPHVPAAGRLWDEADLVIAVGSDLDGMNTQNWRQPQPPHLLAVNPDARDATKNYRADAVVTAVPHHDGTRAPWADLDAVRAEIAASIPAEPRMFLGAFEGALPEGTVVVADMCIPGYWLAGFHRAAAPRRFQYPMGWGTLGFAFPAAIGAALAHDAPTVAICGDGGFLFACGELATVAQERIPLTTVIVDDGGYGMLRFDQVAKGHERFGVDLDTPDFASLAASFGIRAETVDGLADEFGAALARHAGSPEPSVLVAHATLDPPPTTSPRWYRQGAPAWAS